MIAANPHVNSVYSDGQHSVYQHVEGKDDDTFVKFVANLRCWQLANARRILGDQINN